MTTEQQRDQTPPDLAGEYVLGTMADGERTEFAARLLDDRLLQAEVASWERRLSPLLEAVEPVRPPPQVWRDLEQRIGRQPRSSRLWSSFGFWRNLGIAASAAVVVLTLTLLQVRQGVGDMDRMLVVMNDRSQAGWIVAADADANLLRVQAVAPSEMPQGKFCQLWMEDADGRLMPVGVLPHHGSENMDIPAAFREGSRFKVSIENVANTPLTQPSSNIVFVGSMVKM